MNTKLLMTLSSLIMGVVGIILLFFPHELLNYFTSGGEVILSALVLQILGALYFAFAMVNWTAKPNLIGGIYGRPISIGNLLHFSVGALALLK
jgi:Na+-driven multidrug efflux pump